MTVKNKKPNSPNIWNKKPEITKAVVKVKEGKVEVYTKAHNDTIKRVGNVYSANYSLIDETIVDIKKMSRKVSTNDYAANNVYLILQDALKKITLAEK
tara:strand:- start:488 stop:781 length:294 start_codon:yes stop_codon:yes gene_type:complete